MPLRPPYRSCALEAVLKKDPSTCHWPLDGLSSRPVSGNPFATSPTPLAIRLVDALPLAHTASPPPFFPSLSLPSTAAAPATTSHSRSSATSATIAIHSSLSSVYSTCVSLGDFNCAFTTTSPPSVVRFPVVRILPRLFFLCAAFRDRRIAWPVVPSGA